MKKKFFLSLLAFFALSLAACGGNPASEEGGEGNNTNTNTNTNTGGNTNNGGNTNTGGNTPIASTLVGSDTVYSEGYCINVGNKYFQLEQRTADDGRLETFKVGDAAGAYLSVPAGATISLFANGSTLSTWLEDCPLYVERSTDGLEKSSVTLTNEEEAKVIVILHTNVDHSHALWVMLYEEPQQGGNQNTDGVQYTFTVTAPANWNLESIRDGGAVIYVHVFGGEFETAEWVLAGGEGSTVTINLDKVPGGFVVVRCPEGTVEGTFANNWGQTPNIDYVENQTTYVAEIGNY